MEESVSSSSSASAGGSAKVRFGVYSKQGDMVGRTVGDVRSEFSGVWGIPEDANAFNGSTKLADDHVIGNDDNIEFHRRSGEKG